jgi:hypothetical protein
MNSPPRKSAEELNKMQKICIVDVAHQDLFYNYLDDFGNKYNEDGVLIETVGSTGIPSDLKQKPKEKVD